MEMEYNKMLELVPTQSKLQIQDPTKQINIQTSHMQSKQTPKLKINLAIRNMPSMI